MSGGERAIMRSVLVRSVFVSSSCCFFGETTVLSVTELSSISLVATEAVP